MNLIERKNLQITSQLIGRFNISTSKDNVNEVEINLDNDEKSFRFITNESDKLYIYDKETDNLEITIENFNTAEDIIKHLICYIDKYYRERDYSPIETTCMFIQADGCYHTEPNSVVFVKNEFALKNIDSIVFLPDNRVIAVSESKEEFIFDKDSYISSGMYLE
ncbi:MAG: hypothetical protein IJ086_05710 [Clostridium sp.]|nr:hypothetical protein [Clostridium sp.]